MKKNGRNNVYFTNRERKHYRYCRDIFNTLVHCQWRRLLLTIFTVYFFSYFVFACAWHIIAASNGDLEFHPNKIHKPCIIGAKSFVQFILLSVETQTTIGFGEWYPTEHCVEGWVLLGLQMLVGITIEGVFISAAVAKLIKPKVHEGAQVFSEKAVVSIYSANLRSFLIL